MASWIFQGGKADMDPDNPRMEFQADSFDFAPIRREGAKDGRRLFVRLLVSHGSAWSIRSHTAIWIEQLHSELKAQCPLLDFDEVRVRATMWDYPGTGFHHKLARGGEIAHSAFVECVLPAFTDHVDEDVREDIDVVVRLSFGFSLGTSFAWRARDVDGYVLVAPFLNLGTINAPLGVGLIAHTIGLGKGLGAKVPPPSARYGTVVFHSTADEVVSFPDNAPAFRRELAGENQRYVTLEGKHGELMTSVLPWVGHEVLRAAMRKTGSVVAQSPLHGLAPEPALCGGGRSESEWGYHRRWEEGIGPFHVLCMSGGVGCNPYDREKEMLVASTWAKGRASYTLFVAPPGPGPAETIILKARPDLRTADLRVQTSRHPFMRDVPWQSSSVTSFPDPRPDEVLWVKLYDKGELVVWATIVLSPSELLDVGGTTPTTATPPPPLPPPVVQPEATTASSSSAPAGGRGGGGSSSAGGA